MTISRPTSSTMQTKTLTFRSGWEYSTISSSEEDNDDGDAPDVNTSSRSDIENTEPLPDINDHHLTLTQLIREKAATQCAKVLPQMRFLLFLLLSPTNVLKGPEKLFDIDECYSQ